MYLCALSNSEITWWYYEGGSKRACPYESSRLLSRRSHRPSTCGPITTFTSFLDILPLFLLFWLLPLSRLFIGHIARLTCFRTFYQVYIHYLIIFGGLFGSCGQCASIWVFLKKKILSGRVKPKRTGGAFFLPKSVKNTPPHTPQMVGICIDMYFHLVICPKMDVNLVKGPKPCQFWQYVKKKM